MPDPTQRGNGINRGPAAAAANRRAILAAAQSLFAERGYHVPLNAIARRAGVGQGVLYRHFPTRLDLALTVFDENFNELEAIAASGDSATFEHLWRRLVDLTIEVSAFIEMAVDARGRLAAYDGTQRLRELLTEPLDAAREAGLVPASLTVDEVLLTLRMVYGVVTTSPADRVREHVGGSLRLVGWTPDERAPR